MINGEKSNSYVYLIFKLEVYNTANSDILKLNYKYHMTCCKVKSTIIRNPWEFYLKIINRKAITLVYFSNLKSK
jgi:hypothetical protein